MEETVFEWLGNLLSLYGIVAAIRLFYHDNLVIAVGTRSY